MKKGAPIETPFFYNYECKKTHLPSINIAVKLVEPSTTF